jgi:hypothetical protein
MILILILDDNKFRSMYLNFHGVGQFKYVTKTREATEVDNVGLKFIGCINPNPS